VPTLKRAAVINPDVVTRNFFRDTHDVLVRQRQALLQFLLLLLLLLMSMFLLLLMFLILLLVCLCVCGDERFNT
jgi:hypothetical protein